MPSLQFLVLHSILYKRNRHQFNSQRRADSIFLVIVLKHFIEFCNSTMKGSLHFRLVRIPFLKLYTDFLNLLNAKLNPSCKSQIAEFF